MTHDPRNGYIWRGKSPFTIGEVDDKGKVIDSFAAKHGEVIPYKWLKLWHENKPVTINDKGHYSPELVENYYKENRCPKCHQIHDLESEECEPEYLNKAQWEKGHEIK